MYVKHIWGVRTIVMASLFMHHTPIEREPIHSLSAVQGGISSMKSREKYSPHILDGSFEVLFPIKY